MGCTFFPTLVFSQTSSCEAGVLIFMKPLLALLPCHSGTANDVFFFFFGGGGRKFFFVFSQGIFASCFPARVLDNNDKKSGTMTENKNLFPAIFMGKINMGGRDHDFGRGTPPEE